MDREPCLLTLGTAQLGMAYGIANTGGMPGPEAATALVAAALAEGIRRFDTAAHYGTSEAVLGRALRETDGLAQALVTSKLSPRTPAHDPDAVAAEAARSVALLGGPLEALLLHDENVLDRWDARVEAALAGVLDRGLARRVGVSVYSPRRALQALEKDLVGVVQIPGNALDLRFEAAGVPEAARRRGARLMVRSVFLQGLLVMPPEAAPARMAHSLPLVRGFQQAARRHGLEPDAAAMAYARRAFPDAQVLFGAQDEAQLRRNVAAYRLDLPEAALAEFRALARGVPEEILNPSLWPKAD